MVAWCWLNLKAEGSIAGRLLEGLNYCRRISVQQSREHYFGKQPNGIYVASHTALPRCERNQIALLEAPLFTVTHDVVLDLTSNWNKFHPAACAHLALGCK